MPFKRSTYVSVIDAMNALLRSLVTYEQKYQISSDEFYMSLSGAPRGARVPVGEIPTQQICHSDGRRRDGMNGNVHSRGSQNQ